MSIAVHVGVGVGRRASEQVERVLPAEVEEDGLDDKGSNHDGVSQELV